MNKAFRITHWALFLRLSLPLQYSHYKDMKVVKPSYLYNGNSYTGKTVSLYRIGPDLLWRESNGWRWSPLTRPVMRNMEMCSLQLGEQTIEFPLTYLGLNKLRTFCRGYFRKHFILYILIQRSGILQFFLESLIDNRYVNFGSDNGLVPNCRQTIAYNNACQVGSTNVCKL